MAAGAQLFWAPYGLYCVRARMEPVRAAGAMCSSHAFQGSERFRLTESRNKPTKQPSQPRWLAIVPYWQITRNREPLTAFVELPVVDKGFRKIVGPKDDVAHVSPEGISKEAKKESCSLGQNKIRDTQAPAASASSSAHLSSFRARI